MSDVAPDDWNFTITLGLTRGPCQVFVEALDKRFENVCELDLIFHSDKVHHILDEIGESTGATTTQQELG